MSAHIDVEGDFAADGAVCVRGFLHASLTSRLRGDIEAHLASPGPLGLVASDADDPGRFFEDFCNWERFASYRDLAEVAAPVAAELMGSREVRLYHDHLLVKEARTRQRTPWHQDQPFYDVDGWNVISMWAPVDPVTRAATLEFVAGSHLAGWCMPRTFRDQQAKWFPEHSLAEVPDVEADRDAFRILGWELEPGDVVFFHALTIHGSAGSTNRRRVVSIRYLGDDATFAPRPWRTSPPTHDDVARDLAAGSPMHHARFPLLLS